MRAALVVVALLALAGCKKDEPVVKAPAKALSQLAPSPDGQLHGKVLERLEAPGYTYLRVGSETAETWVAVPTNPVAVGTEVAVAGLAPMPGFESKTLNRKWEMIYFAAGVSIAGTAAPSPGPADPAAFAAPTPALPPTAATPAVELANIKVDKATGADARTIAELFSQKAGLKDKTVSVRGKVVKFTANVMGKNWLHLRDGSGADGTKDNDLTVTSAEVAAVNDVVTVQGVVHLDKVLGAGYEYPVLIEDAKVTK